MKKASLNHVFKLVWNHALEAFVPVSELAKSSGKRGTIRQLLIGGVIGLAGVPIAAQTVDPVIVDGAGGGGAFVGGYFGGDNALEVGNTDQQSIFTGFYTEGGAGSGGGAGLGGVFYVDEGASLTVINGVFIGNKIKGGEGGALPASRVGDTFINAAPFSLNLIGYEQQLATPDLVYNADTNNYEFSSIGVNTGTDLLTAGSTVSFNDLTGTPSATIQNTSGGTVLLDSTVSIDNSDVRSSGAADVTRDIDGVVTAINTSGYEIDGNTITFYEETEGDLDSLLSNIALNGQIFLEGENAVIDVVNYGNGGVIESITLDRTLVGVSGTGALDVINVTKFNTQQFAITGSQVTVTGDLRGFQTGMQLFDSDGNNLDARITSVASDGASFTVDNPANLAGVSSLSAKKTPIVADNQIALTTPRDEISVGVTIYVPDTGFSAVVTAYDEDTGLITLDTNIDADIRESVDGGDPLTLAVRNVLDVTGDTLTVRKQADQPLEAGMVINGTNIASDSTIESVVDNGTTYTITLSSGSIEDPNVTSIIARSSLSQGGAMNGLTASGNSGSNGSNGFDANYYSSFFNEGEGGEGTRGYSGDSGSTGTGFNGGNGGNGSDGLGVNLQLITELYGATTDFVDSVGELAGAIAPDGFPPTPDYADIPFAVVDVVAKSISLGTAIANTVFWAQNLERGLAGMGGDGGDGGEAGGGAMFFGGGTGGDGGNGGEGARSHTDAGNGGGGGRGGDGGFGAGGGSGGAGGIAGSTGAADDGDPGDGGFGGFGAGEGSNGNGLFGGGGSGFGGAIFVRDGGSLIITGESLFENNVASGGSSNNRGSAGDGAGAALFMMTGATVTLSPGFGNTIRFEDDIADDSSATFEGAPVAEGAGADITIAGDGGIVIFNAENTYTGDTILEGATLDAEFGEGIHYSSRLRFNGSGTVGGTGLGDLSLENVGTLLQSEDVTARRQGFRAHEITWTGSGGFASSAEEGIRINLGETINGIGQTLSWGENGFFADAAVNSTLTFGSEYSEGAVNLENNVRLNNNTSRVAVYNTGSDVSSNATLSGNWTGGDLMIGSDTYSGTLYLTGQNQIDNLTIFGGFTTTEGGGTLSTEVAPTNILINAGHLELIQNEFLGTLSVMADGELTAEGHITTTDIDNIGVITANGGVVATNITNLSNATINANSDFTVSGTVLNSATALWNQSGDLSADAVINNGQWNVYGLGMTDGTRTITLDTLTGDGTFSLISTLQDDASITNGHLDIVQASTSTFDGIIEGAGSVGKEGAGTLRVSNAHTFTGGLDVTGGTFETLASGGLLADTGAIHVFDGATFIAGNNDTVGSVEIDSNGTFVMNADITTQTDFTNNGLTSLANSQTLTTGGGLNGAGDITVADAAEFELVQTGDTTYSGTIIGDGSFTKDGEGTLTLTGIVDSIDLDEGITVNAGILRVDATNVFHTDQNILVNDGELNILQDQRFNLLTVVLDGEVDSSGHITTDDIDNTGIFTATGGVNATNITNQPNGLFNALSNVAVSGTVLNSASAEWSQAGDLSASAVVNNGQWNVFGLDDADGTRTITLNTLTGDGTFSLISTLQDDESITNGHLDIVQSGTSTFDGVIEGAGSVEKEGAGTLRVSNTHTFTGGLDVTGGTFETLAASASPLTSGGLLADTGAIHVFNGAQFIAGNNDTVGSVEVDANGAFVMNANITTQTNFTNNGLTTLANSQTLTTGGGLNGAGDITVADAAELSLIQSGNTTYSGTIIGDGGFTKDGAGTLTLNGVADSIDLDEGVTVDAGVLLLDSMNVLHTDQNVLVNDGEFNILQTQRFNLLTVALDGVVNSSAHTTTDDIDNTGMITALGGVYATNITNQPNGLINALSDIVVDSTVLNSVGAEWNQVGELDANAVINNGQWNVFGLEDADATRTITLNTLTGYGTFSLISTLQDDDSVTNGHLDIIQAGISTFDGVMEGAGSVEKEGAGTLRVSNTHTFTGGLDVTGGTFETLAATASPLTTGGLLADTVEVHVFDGARFIAGNNDTVGTVEVDSNGTFEMNADVTTQTHFTNNGLTILANSQTLTTGGGLNGAGDVTVADAAELTLLQSGSTTYSGTIIGEGSFTKDGEGTLRLTGVEDAISLEEGVTVDAGILLLDSVNVLHTDQNVLVADGEFNILQSQRFNLLTVALDGVVNSTAHITTDDIDNTGMITATGGVNATNITNQPNGTMNALSDIVVGGTVLNSVNAEWNQVGELDADAVINNGQWNIFGLEDADATRTITLNTLTGTGTFSLTSTLQNDENITSGHLDIVQVGTSTFDGVIEGAGSVEKDGAGTLRVSNTHTFTGGLDVTGGTFETLAATASPLTTGGLLADTVTVHVFDGARFIAGNNDTVGSIEVDANGTLVMNADITTQAHFTNNGLTTLANSQVLTTGGGLNGAGDITVADAAMMTLIQTSNTTYSGSLIGDGSFTKDGDGTLRLTGIEDSINLDEGITVDTGILMLDSVNSLHTDQNVLVNDGELAVLQDQRFNLLTVALDGAATTSGHITTNNIDNTGVMTVIGGVEATNVTNQPNGTFNALSDVVVSGTVLNSAAAEWNQVGDLSADAVINNGQWNVFGLENADGTRTTTLNTLTGAGTFTLISMVQEDASVTNGHFDIVQAGTSTFDGVIEGAGSIGKQGAGTLRVSNTHIFTGGLDVKGGTFETLAATASPVTTGGLLADTLAIHVFDGASFIAGNTDTVGSINIDSNGAFVMNAGITTQGNVTNNGLTTLANSQTLAMGGGLNGAGDITVADAAVFTLVQDGSTTYSGTVIGDGSFAKDGMGTLTLTGEEDSIDLTAGITITAGVLSLDGENILAASSDVFVGAAGEIELANGNQRINQLVGIGTIDLGDNTLSVQNGGEFEGNVAGQGTLDIVNGVFNVNNSIVSTTGVFNVNTGATTVVASSAMLRFPVISVQTSGSLTIAGDAIADNDLIVHSAGNLHLGEMNNTGNIQTPTASIYGTLTGNGSVSGNTTVYSDGVLAPGNSPGILTFENLTINNDSTAQMEIISSGTAGSEFDQIVVTNRLQIEDGAVLELIKYIDSPDTDELAMGERVKVLNFAPGAVSGRFGSVTSTFDNDVVFNVATGEVIGLGGVSVAAFKSATATTANRKALLSDLSVNAEGGVEQFYGGTLLPEVASAYGDSAALDTVFAKASPEVYSALLDQSRLAVVTDLSGFSINPDAVEHGISVAYWDGKNSTNNGSQWAKYDLKHSSMQVAYTFAYDGGAIQASGSKDHRDIESRYMNATTDGQTLSLSAAQALPIEDLRVLAHASWSDQSSDLNRTTIASQSTAKNVDASSSIFSLGVGYSTLFDTIAFDSSLNFMSYEASVNGFNEVNSEVLDTLVIQDQEVNGTAFLLKLGAIKQFGEKWLLGSELSYLSMRDATDYEVTSNVSAEDTFFTVTNPGVGSSLTGIDFSATYQITDNWSVVLDTKLTGSSGDLTGKALMTYAF